MTRAKIFTGLFVVVALALTTNSSALSTTSTHGKRHAVPRCTKTAHPKSKHYERCRRKPKKSPVPGSIKPTAGQPAHPGAGPQSPASQDPSAITRAGTGAGEPRGECPKVELYEHPVSEPGREELSGAIYDIGGPVGSEPCNSLLPPQAGTISVYATTSNELVATQTVRTGEFFNIVLPEGSYKAESTKCDPEQRAVKFGVTQGQTTHYDFLCNIS
jgi:hypothetical protein